MWPNWFHSQTLLNEGSHFQPFAHVFHETVISIPFALVWKLIKSIQHAHEIIFILNNKIIKFSYGINDIARFCVVNFCEWFLHK